MKEKNESYREIVPSQEEGAKKDIDHTVTALDDNDARKLFMIARNRLVDVNHWHEYAGPVTSTFRLTDPNGIEVNRTAEKGDHFKIDLPAPGPAENGFDWVRVEAIEDHSSPDGPGEIFAMRVRPVPDPTEKGENVSHFFKDNATSSFIVERKGRVVTAAVFGRNEIPNTETSNVIDKVRNAIIGVGAILGFANVQWKNLVKGLLSAD